MIPRKTSFYEVDEKGNWEFFIDNTLLRYYNECPASFYERFMRNGTGIVGKGKRSWAISLGSWWSSTMEMFYTAIQQNKLTQAIAVEAAVHCWGEHKMDELSVLPNYEKFGGSFGAVTMISRYYEAFGELHSKNWEVIAAEKTFGDKRSIFVGGFGSFKEPCLVHKVYWTGKPDLFIRDRVEDRLMPIDHKTRERIDSDIHSRFKPHQQIAGYIYSSQKIMSSLGWDKTIDRCIVNVAARTEPSEKPRDGKPKPRFVQVYPQFSQEEIEEWRLQILYKVERLQISIESEFFTWNEAACHNYSGCQYRRLHSVKPSSRDIVIQSDFVPAERWTPYETPEEV